MFPKCLLTHDIQHYVNYQTLFSLVVKLDQDKNRAEISNKMGSYLITVVCRRAIQLHPQSSDPKDKSSPKFGHVTPTLAKYHSKT